MKSARDRIFEKLKMESRRPRREKPRAISTQYENPVAVFEESLSKAGGTAVYVEGELCKTIYEFFPNVEKAVDTTGLCMDGFVYSDGEEADLAIIEAEFAVAENGAVWIDTKDAYPRTLLTLSESIAVVLKKEKVVENMHHAYDLIDFSELAYGLFISGPSKTADIEQSLVLGAHGAVNLTVFMLP